jgi:hypothetical protein
MLYPRIEIFIPYRGMDETTIKKITITGAAADSMSPTSYSGGDTPRKKTQKRKKLVIEPPVVQKIVEMPPDVKKGAGMSPGTLDQLVSTSVSGPANRPPYLLIQQPVRIGGAPEQRVVLAKSEKAGKVILGAPPAKKQVEHKSKNKTAKRVKVSIGGMNIRLKRAKTIKNKTKAHTLDEIKAELVKASLIKADSKAPEDVLRHMYNDYMVLKKRAL